MWIFHRSVVKSCCGSRLAAPPVVFGCSPAWSRKPSRIRWQELEAFAFSENGFALGATGRAHGHPEIGAAARGGSKAGVGDTEPDANGVQERQRRWDQPFHHAVPNFPRARAPDVLAGRTDSAGHGLGFGSQDGGVDDNEGEGLAAREFARGVRIPRTPDGSGLCIS